MFKERAIAMKRVIALFLFILFVLFSCVGHAEKEKETIIPDALFFSEIDAPDVVDTAEHRKQAVAVIIRYAVLQTEDEICKQFCDTFLDMCGDMKVNIGTFKKGTTIAAIAFRNGDYYGFTVTHYPQLSLKPEIRQYEKSFIKVEKLENHYDDFEKSMSNVAKKNNITFYELSPNDVLSAYSELFISE